MTKQAYQAADGKIFETEQAAIRYNSSSAPSALTDMTVEELRSLCTDRGIQWRGYRGKNLSKARMIAHLLSQPPLLVTVAD